MSRVLQTPLQSGGDRNSIAVVALRYPIVVLTVGVGLVTIGLLAFDHHPVARWLASGWALVVAGRVALHMIRDMLAGHWGVDLLAVTAITATVAVGEFLAALVVVLMLTGGQALEDFAANRARKDLRSLLERAPTVAHRSGPVDTVVDVPVEEVRPGDVILVRPSEVVPVDGDLLSPEADLDESSLTGESLPVTHRAGDPILSGSLNTQQAITLRATATVGQSQYSRIVAMVEAAAESRAPVVRLADRYAVPFTALAFVIAGLAWWYHGDPVVFAEVLVVATPCPLLIAAPVAFLGGMSRAAHTGAIIKDAGTLERLAAIRTVAFDKTGTITYGRPEIQAVNARPPWSQEELLRLAASAEQYSSHVLATSIREAARARGLDLASAPSAEEEATAGVTAFVEGQQVLVGKRARVRSATGDVADQPLESGHLAVYVGINDHFAGTIVMSDHPRADAARTVSELAELGIDQCLILSGDLRSTVEHIAHEVGIENSFAECLPEDKVRLMCDLPARPVLMVGDGVNDAPVLAAADVGVAMGARGSTAASESADIVILTEDLSKTAEVIRIGRRTVRVALQSIWLGIGLSVALMAVAATGSIPAILGALSQEVVDLLTILNALRALRGERPPKSDPHRHLREELRA